MFVSHLQCDFSLSLSLQKVAERDTFMANGLNGLNQFPTTVAVMGIAHVDGVENNLRNMGWEPVVAGCTLVKT